MASRLGCVGQFVGIVVLLAAIGIGWYEFDAIIAAPWAHGSGPLLTRTWVGAFQSPGGRRGVLEMTLERDWGRPGTHGQGYRGRPLLKGSARSCGLVDWPAYDLTGTANRSASDVNIVIAVPRPAPPGLYLHELRGSWSGDSLRLAGVLAAYAGTTNSYHGGAIDENQPTHFTLHPGTAGDFDHACRDLKAANR
jgi:hypothetical protein